MHNHLFWGPHWSDVEEHQRTLLETEIAKIDGNRLLNTSIDDLCDYLEQKYKIDVPVIHDDQVVVDQRETPIDVSSDFDRAIFDRSRPFLVPGTVIEAIVPFSGDSSAFNIRTTVFTTTLPRARVRDNSLTIEVKGTDLDPDTVKNEIQKTLSEIRESLGNLCDTASEFNGQIRQLALERLNRRRQKLLSDRNLVASLGFPLRESTDTPRTFTVPDVQRRLRPAMPLASTTPYKPEPSLSNDDYDHILSVMSNMALVMERSPEAFAAMDEEALRFHFLVQLNGHYEGQASGETFNFEGKTDILIRTDGRNIFIAECKYWSGAKKFGQTIDQILGYLSWRDTKAAIVVLCRNRNFSKVLNTIPHAAKKHANFKREIGVREEGQFRYIFANRDDRNREMTLAVLVFHVPQSS
ncbi:MAG: hypothetical protein OXI46_06275 [Gemmatimonadota bacterium]|nr:hypothetical protein [Gemmatimonadota bacterium]